MDDVEVYLQTLIVLNELVAKKLLSQKTLLSFPKFFEDELIFTNNEYYNIISEERNQKLTEIVI